MTPAPLKLGLSLSGGGYRATAFHLGTLQKLHEMGVLEKAEVMSTISGGSITGAAYGLHQGDFNSFYDALYTGLQTKNVVKKVLLSWMGLRFLLYLLLMLGSFGFLFTPYPWLSPLVLVLLIIILIRFQFVFFHISRRIEEIYDQFFYQKKTLSDLREKPVLVIGSTNLQTARPFTFSKTWMQDSTYQYRRPPVEFHSARFPVARAVMASSCVPFAFTPIQIAEEFFVNKEDAKIIHPALVDGGVYDNQGIHKIVQSGQYACTAVITSDAGAGGSGELTFRNTFGLLLETVNVFMSRIKKAQMMSDVYQNAGTANRQIAYLSLGWDVEKCIPGFISALQRKQVTEDVIAAHQLKPEWVADPKKYAADIQAFLEQQTGYAGIPKPTDAEKKVARAVGTNLTALSRSQVDCLIKQARALTEIQVKLYCPGVL